MANLPKGSTINGFSIIGETNKNNHTHSVNDIIGLNSDLIGDSEVYAERIDGVTYQEMQTTFLSDANHTMTGDLNVSVSVYPNTIVNIQYINNTIYNKYDDNAVNSVLGDFPNPSSVFNDFSILITSDTKHIDDSWIPFTGYDIKESVSIVGTVDDLFTNNSHIIDITNFDSFTNYTVSTSLSGSSANINYQDGNIVYSAPETLVASADTITISNGMTSKNIDVTLVDPPVTLSGDEILTPGVSYEFTIENYHPLHTYTYSIDFTGTINRTDDILTIVPDSGISTTTNGIISINKTSGTLSSSANEVVIEP